MNAKRQANQEVVRLESEQGSTIRRDVVEAAARIFSQRGFHGTSMQHIADDLGMRKASLYYHVSRKEDLLYAIHLDLLNTLIEQTIEVVATDATPVDKLRNVLRINANLVADNLAGVNVLQKETHAVTGERWAALVSKRDLFEQMVREVLRDGIRRGVFVDRDPSLTAKAILAMPGWMATWFRPEGPLSADDCAQLFSEVALTGISMR